MCHVSTDSALQMLTVVLFSTAGLLLVLEPAWSKSSRLSGKEDFARENRWRKKGLST